MPNLRSLKAGRVALYSLQLSLTLAGCAISIVFVYENLSSFTRSPATERVWFATIYTGLVIYLLATIWSLLAALWICLWNSESSIVIPTCWAGLALCFLGYAILLCLQTQYLPTCVSGKDWLGFSNATACALWKASLAFTACLFILSCVNAALQIIIKRKSAHIEEDNLWGANGDGDTSLPSKELPGHHFHPTGPWSPNHSAGTLLDNQSQPDDTTILGSSSTAVNLEEPAPDHSVVKPASKESARACSDISPDVGRGGYKKKYRIRSLHSRSPTPDVTRPGSGLSTVSREAPSITKSTLDFGETFGESAGFQAMGNSGDSASLRAISPEKQVHIPPRIDSVAKRDLPSQKPRASSELYDSSRMAFFKSIPTPTGHRRARSSLETPRPSTSSSGVIARPSFSSKRSASRSARLEVPDNFLTEIGKQPPLPVQRAGIGARAGGTLEPIASAEDLSEATVVPARTRSKRSWHMVELPAISLFSGPQRKASDTSKSKTPATPDWSPTIQHIKNASQQISSGSTSPTLNVLPKHLLGRGTPSPNALVPNRTASRTSTNGTTSALSVRHAHNTENPPQSPTNRAMSPVSSSGSLRSTQPSCSTHRNRTWRAVSPENTTWVGNCVFRTIAYMLGLEPHVVFACRDKGYSLPPQGLTLDEIKLLLRRLADFVLPSSTRPVVYFPPPERSHRPQPAGEESLEAICAQDWDANRLGVLLRRSDGSCHCDLYVRNYLSTKVTGYKRYSDFRHLEDTDAHCEVKEPGTVVVGVFAFMSSERADALVTTGGALDWDEQQADSATGGNSAAEDSAYDIRKPYTISSDTARTQAIYSRF